MAGKYDICPICEGEGVTFLRVQTLFDEDDRGSWVERLCDRCFGRSVIKVEPEEEID